MHKRRTSGRALIIGKNDRRVELVKHHLTDYFGKVELLTDLGQLNLLTADNFAVIVVTDTFEGVLKPESRTVASRDCSSFKSIMGTSGMTFYI